MSRFKKAKILLFGAVLALYVTIIAACCPVPVQRESLKWPTAEFTITDEQGRPIPDCRLTLYLWSYPHRRFEDNLVLTSDAGGKIAVEETTFDERIMPLMMHGVPEYHWSYFIYKEGYVTVGGNIMYAEEGGSVKIDAVMREGESRDFVSFEDFEVFTITFPYSSNGYNAPPVDIEVIPEDTGTDE